DYQAVWSQLRQTLPGEPDFNCANHAQPWRCPADNGHYRAIFRDGPKLDPGPLVIAAAEEQRQREAELAKDQGTVEGDRVARAIAWLSKRDPAIQGAGGSTLAFVTAGNIVHGFGLDDATAFRVLNDNYNKTKCFPPWKPADLMRKIKDARKNGRYF